MPYLQIDPNDLPYLLPADAYAYLVRTLDRCLPSPPDASDETATLHKHAIIAQISVLRPNDSVEAELAAGFIVANEQFRDASAVSYPDPQTRKHKTETSARRTAARPGMAQAPALISRCLIPEWDRARPVTPGFVRLGVRSLCQSSGSGTGRIRPLGRSVMEDRNQKDRSVDLQI